MRHPTMLPGVLAIFIAILWSSGTSSGTEIATTETLVAAQITETVGTEPFGEVQVAAEPRMGGKPLPPHPEDSNLAPSSPCNSTAVSQPNQWNCTSGSQCTDEGRICNKLVNPNKTCKTQVSESTCYCSCTQ